MFENRVFWEPEEPIVDFEFTNPDTGEIHNSPFAVLAYTHAEEFLGVGSIVGQLGFGDGAKPIIEIDDDNAPNSKIHLIGGKECIWEFATERSIASIDTEIVKEGLSAYLHSYRLDVANQAALN